MKKAGHVSYRGLCTETRLARASDRGNCEGKRCEQQYVALNGLTFNLPSVTKLVVDDSRKNMMVHSPRVRGDTPAA